MDTRIRTFALKYLLEHQQDLQADPAYAHDIAETLIAEETQNPYFATAARDLVMQIVLHLTADGTKALCLPAIEEILRAKERLAAVLSAPAARRYLEEPNGEDIVYTARSYLYKFKADKDLWQETP